MMASIFYKELKENLIWISVFLGTQYLLFSYTLSSVGNISLLALQSVICILLALNLVILTQKTNEKFVIGCLAGATILALLTIKYVTPQ